MVFPEGTSINGYTIARLINEGNTSTVYEALQVNLNRNVALKIVQADLSSDPDYLEDFKSQAQALASLNHNHIVQTFDSSHAEGHHYLSMELVSGGDFDRLIDHEETIDELHALQTMLNIAKGLAFAFEEKQLTHGDIKPANLLISSEGKTKLADLGLARLGNHHFSELTDPHPYYAAPEIIQNKWNDSDPSADIYSFGATLYHMVTGEPPFFGEEYRDIIEMHLSGSLDDPLEINPELHPITADLIFELCALRADHRPENWPSVIRKISNAIKKIKSGKTRSLNQNPSRHTPKESTSPVSKSIIIAACVITALIVVLLNLTPPKTIYLNEIKPQLGKIPAAESLEILENFVYRYGDKGEQIAGEQLRYYKRMNQFTPALVENKLSKLQKEIHSFESAADWKKAITKSSFRASSGLMLHLPLDKDLRNHAGRFDLSPQYPAQFIPYRANDKALHVDKNFKYESSHPLLDKLSNGLSLSLWTYVQHNKSIILGVNGLLRLSLDDGRLKFAIKAGNESQRSVAITKERLGIGKWIHIAVSYPGLGGGPTKFWINGNECPLESWDNSISKDYSPNKPASLYTAAMISLNNIRFYNRPLDTSDVQILLNEKQATELEKTSAAFYLKLNKRQ